MAELPPDLRARIDAARQSGPRGGRRPGRAQLMAEHRVTMISVRLGPAAIAAGAALPPGGVRLIQCACGWLSAPLPFGPIHPVCPRR
jgi:hypothetical protein